MKYTARRGNNNQAPKRAMVPSPARSRLGRGVTLRVGDLAH